MNYALLMSIMHRLSHTNGIIGPHHHTRRFANHAAKITCIRRLIVGHAMGQPPWKYAGVRNGSITHMVLSDDGWTLRAFNDASHTGSLTADHGPA